MAPSSAAGLYPVVKLFESEDIIGILGVFYLLTQLCSKWRIKIMSKVIYLGAIKK